MTRKLRRRAAVSGPSPGAAAPRHEPRPALAAGTDTAPGAFLLVDDDVRVCRALASRFRRLTHLELEYVHDLQTALRAIRSGHSYLGFFFDVRLTRDRSDWSGLEAVAAARKAHQNAPIRILSGYVDATVREHGERERAEVVSKDGGLAYDLERFVARAVARYLLPDDEITAERVAEVCVVYGFPPSVEYALVLAAYGATNPEIADLLGISKKTAAEQVGKAFGALGAGNRRDFVRGFERSRLSRIPLEQAIAEVGDESDSVFDRARATPRGRPSRASKKDRE